MLLPRPLFCRPEAYDFFAAQLPVIESAQGLVNAAVAISMHEMAEVDPGRVDLQLQSLADDVRSRVRGRQAQALLAHAHEVLFEEQGFTGNAEDYYNPVNSYLPAVLSTRRGLPITLCLLYKAVLERVGLRVVGIGAPGHFLAAVDLRECPEGNGAPAAEASLSPPHGVAGSLLLVDTFYHGRTVSPDEVVRGLQDTMGVPFSDPRHALPVLSHRQWLMRLLLNLLNNFTRTGPSSHVGAMLEFRALLERDPHVKREAK